MEQSLWAWQSKMDEMLGDIWVLIENVTLLKGVCQSVKFTHDWW